MIQQNQQQKYMQQQPQSYQQQPQRHRPLSLKERMMLQLRHILSGKGEAFWNRPMAWQDVLLPALVGAAFAGFIGYVFYSGLYAVMFAMPLGLAAVPLHQRKRAARERERFVQQFKDLLYYLSVSLSAGKSLESSLKEAARSLSGQYGRNDSLLMEELGSINRRLEIREPVERLLGELADKTGLEDVRSLADVVSVCRRAGGNLVEVMQQSVHILREKMEICREMETAWAAKKLEQRILCISPVLLVLMVRMGSGDFMEPMYGTAIGRIIMTAALLMVIAGYCAGERIMRTRV